jgi:hypothetical protein
VARNSVSESSLIVESPTLAPPLAPCHAVTLPP